MEQGMVIQLAQQTLWTVLLVSAPMLSLTLIIGLAISIFQATTQIQEQTLTFIPKILGVMAGIAVFGSWMMHVLIEFTRGIYLNMHQFIK